MQMKYSLDLMTESESPQIVMREAVSEDYREIHKRWGQLDAQLFFTRANCYWAIRDEEGEVATRSHGNGVDRRLIYEELSDVNGSYTRKIFNDIPPAQRAYYAARAGITIEALEEATGPLDK